MHVVTPGGLPNHRLFVTIFSLGPRGVAAHVLLTKSALNFKLFLNYVQGHDAQNGREDKPRLL